jgi:hypothetical protein
LLYYIAFYTLNENKTSSYSEVVIKKHTLFSNMGKKKRKKEQIRSAPSRKHAPGVTRAVS